MLRVLYVDEDQESREMAISLLGGEGDVFVDTAPSAEVALDKITTAQYDAVVSEYFFTRGMNGIDFLRVARANGFQSGFIIFTSQRDEGVATDAILNGADNYLPKTGKLSQDVALIGAILRKREQKEREVKARSEEMAYRTLLMRMRDGFAYLRVLRDENGKPTGSMVVDANSAFEEMMSLSKDTVLGRRMEDVIPDVPGFEHDLLSALNQVARTGREASVQGHSRSMDRWFSASIHSPVPGYIATILTEQTDIKLHEERMELDMSREVLEEQNRDFMTLFDSLPAVILIKDRTNNVVRANKAYAALLGKSPKDVEGRSAYDLTPDQARDAFEADQEVISTGRPRLGMETTISDSEGERHWLLVDKLPYNNANGQTIGVITFALDITNRKQTEEELELARKKLNLLGSITRHDLLNQLTALTGYLGIAQYKSSDDVTKEYMAKALRCGESMRKILEFSRDYERMGAQRPEWLLAQETAEKGVSAVNLTDVKVTIDLQGIEIYADRMLEKVFHNLADNAKRHGRAGRVRFFSSGEGENLRIVCQDDGVGVEEAKRARMFDDRYGHGLYLVKEVLKITGMTISETSRSGQGARFEILVPKGRFRPRDQ